MVTSCLGWLQGALKGTEDFMKALVAAYPDRLVWAATGRMSDTPKTPFRRSPC
ncbi:hypothetical protein ACVWXO_009373 [Bradyrhizobium sp. LM2.7]